MNKQYLMYGLLCLVTLGLISCASAENQFINNFDNIDKMEKIFLDKSELNINAKNKSGHTALMLAAGGFSSKGKKAYNKDSYFNSVEYLLTKSNINVNEQDNKENTALVYAWNNFVIRNYNQNAKNVVTLLMDVSNLDARLSNSETIFMKSLRSVAMPTMPFIREFLKNTQAIDFRNRDGYSGFDILLDSYMKSIANDQLYDELINELQTQGFKMADVTILDHNVIYSNKNKLDKLVQKGMPIKVMSIQKYIDNIDSDARYMQWMKLLASYTDAGQKKEVLQYITNRQNNLMSDTNATELQIAFLKNSEIPNARDKVKTLEGQFKLVKANEKHAKDNLAKEQIRFVEAERDVRDIRKQRDDLVEQQQDLNIKIGQAQGMGDSNAEVQAKNSLNTVTSILQTVERNFDRANTSYQSSRQEIEKLQIELKDAEQVKQDVQSALNNTLNNLDVLENELSLYENELKKLRIQNKLFNKLIPLFK